MHLYPHKRISFIIILANVSIVGLIASAFFIFPTSKTPTSALTYETQPTISFTFSPMISISVSSNTIDIPIMVPNTTAESDPITVTVGTNTAYGYSLYADVGNSTDYNTDSLVHNGEDNNNNTNSTPSVFKSIATNASLPSLTTDNTWGYSFKPSNEATWSTYNGLPLYTTTEGHTSTTNPALLIDTKDPGDSSKSIDFKIAARASSTQPSGTYSNVINFYAVGKPEPIDLPTAFAKSGAQKTEQGYYRMQDMTTEICNSVELIHSTIELQDVRDNHTYSVAKLKDSRCWMTENLDLPGQTKLYSETSNVPEGYPKSGNVPYYTLPASSASKSTDFSSNTRDYAYNVPYSQADRTNCTGNHPCYSYYSWLAATALSGLEITTDNIDAQYSICPKGWKLPTSRNGWASDWQSSDLFLLSTAYGMNVITPSSPSLVGENTPVFYEQAGPSTIPNFLLAGHYNYSPEGMGNTGYYWSSTSTSASNAQYLLFDSGRIYPSWSYERRLGNSIRCIAE